MLTMTIDEQGTSPFGGHVRDGDSLTFRHGDDHSDDIPAPGAAAEDASVRRLSPTAVRGGHPVLPPVERDDISQNSEK